MEWDGGSDRCYLLREQDVDSDRCPSIRRAGGVNYVEYAEAKNHLAECDKQMDLADGDASRPRLGR